MTMTKAQKKTYDELCSEQVGWPALFEADNGAVVVVLTIGFSIPSSWNEPAYFPDSVDLESVRIDADGTQTPIGEAKLVRHHPATVR